MSETSDLSGAVLRRADGRDLGALVDELRSAGQPVHLVSRAINDLLSDCLIAIDEDQRVTRCAEQATIARFGMFEAEERVEKVARAIRSEWLRILGDWADDWADASAEVRDHYRRLAAAAIAAMPASPAEEALRRVEALAERLGDESREFYYDNRHTHENGINYVSGISDAMEQIADRITAALTSEGERE